MMTIEEKLNLVRLNVDVEAHIHVNKSLCRQCEHRACTRICPSECYKCTNEEVGFTYESCLECGACKLVCDKGAIEWRYPRGGFGVCFRFG